MKTIIYAGVAAVTLMVGSLAPAEASGGCGPFAHRGFVRGVYGVCRPNGGYGYGYGYHRPFYGYHRPFYGYGGYGYRRNFY